jgi:hypothetical protein
MMHRPRRLGTAFALILTGPLAAQSGGTLTDGAAAYIQAPAPSGESLASPAQTSFRTESTTPNQLFQNWWYYRVDSGVAPGTREYPFGTYSRSAGGQISGTSNYSGNTAVYNWTDLLGGGGTRFQATYTSTLTHGAQTGTATLSQAFQITNPTPSALTMVLFNYADIDANGPNPLDDDVATGGINSITDVSGGWQVTHSAVGASAYQVTTYSGIRDFLLDSAVNNLDNTGLPFGPGDYTGAFQWNLTIPGGSSVTVTSALAIAPVPEPGTLALTALAGGLVAWRRSSVAKRKRSER